MYLELHGLLELREGLDERNAVEEVREEHLGRLHLLLSAHRLLYRIQVVLDGGHTLLLVEGECRVESGTGDRGVCLGADAVR